MEVQVPVRGNIKLKKLLENINNDKSLVQLWKCANINAVDRCGISDHGEVHIKIVSNAALKLIRLLIEGGVEPNIVTNYKMTNEDAEVVVVLASCLHDVGISIHRNSHEKHSLIIAYPKAKELLKDIYNDDEQIIITSEVMHAIVAHNVNETCLTIEAGVLKVADCIDMSQGRSRIPFQVGHVDIHSVSAQAVESVHIEKGENKPVKIVISLLNSAGIFQIDELLKKKLLSSSIKDFVEVIVKNNTSEEKKIIEVYNF